MNQGIYRLVFNKARGLIMAVGELAKSTSRLASGKTGYPRRQVPRKVARLKPLVFAQLIATGGLFLCQPIWADIVADNQSGQPPLEILPTANGTPQINIQAPSAGGISHNLYTQFSVDQNGVILNNSATHTLTQQAGMVSANPNMINGTAQVILNEVTSTNPSYLNGFIEVAGDRADVIVANPAGITCAGCGFINASKGTLTTGTPLFSNGNLDGYRVTQGVISIGEGGLDASDTDYTHIIARSVEINAAIVASSLNVTTGTNQVDPDNTDITTISSDSNAPTFAVDVAALGGMYAGHIQLVGTEHGVGVRNAGEIGAGVGEFKLTLAAQLENTGSLVAAGNVTVETQDALSNSGIIHSGTHTQINSQSNIVNEGTISANQHTTLTAVGDITQGEQAGLGAGVDEFGNLNNSGLANLSVNANGDIQLSGNQIATGAIDLDADTISLIDAGQEANTVTAQAASVLITDNLLQTAENVNLSAQSITLNNSDQLATNMQLSATHGDLIINQSLVTVNDQLTLTAAGEIQNQNASVVSGTLVAAAANLSNQGEFLQEDTATFATSEAFNNNLGIIHSNDGISVNAAQINNQQGELISGGELMLTTSGDINNQNGSILSEGNNTLSGNNLNNDQGLIQSSQTLELSIDDTLTNTHSGNTGGLLAGADLLIDTTHFENSSGYSGAGVSIAIVGEAVSNSEGQMLSLGDTTISAQLDNNNGQLQSEGDLILNAGDTTLNNQSGLIQAGNALSISAGIIDNTQTNGAQQGLEGGTVNLNVLSFDNTEGQVIADNLTIQAHHSVNNSQGLVSASQAVTIDSQAAERMNSFTNEQGTVIAGQHVDLVSQQLIGQGSILSEGTAVVSLEGDYTHTSDFIANDNFTLDLTGTLDNQAVMMANGDLDIIAAALTNATEGELAATNTRLTVSGTLTNYGLINSAGTTSVTTNRLDNIGTGRLYGTDLVINAVTVNNLANDDNSAAAVIAARDNLYLGVSQLNNFDNSLIYSDGDAFIGNIATNTGVTGSADHIINASADIEVADNLSITTDRLDNLDLYFETDNTVSTRNVVSYQLTWSNQRYDADSGLVYITNAGGDGLNRLVVNGVNYGKDSETYYRYNVTRTITEDTILNSDPGVITSGGQLNLTANNVTNDKSHIIAGGDLVGSVQTLENINATGTRETSEVGTRTEYWRIKDKGQDDQGQQTLSYSGPDNEVTQYVQVAVGSDEDGNPVYQPMPVAITGTARIDNNIELGPAVYEGNTLVTTGFSILPTLIRSPDQTVSVPGLVDSEPRELDSILSVSTADGDIRTVNLAPTLSNNSLFQQNPGSTADYLIETDPQFTNANTWLSSDYLLQQIDNAPAMMHKRLGDGFYEQRLIREQMTELTGRRFLEGYSEDEAQYQALLDNGIAFANQYNLIPGVALSEQQMALLTTDLVWLEKETVTLKDGSTEDVLVPRLYVMVQPGDLYGSGALLSGEVLRLSGDQLVNSGKMVSRREIDLDYRRLTDIQGRLQGESINARGDDLTLTSSRWQAGNNLSLNASRNITLNRQIQTTSLLTGERITSANGTDLRVTDNNGRISIRAGETITVRGTDITNEGTGDTELAAGQQLIVDTVATGETYQHNGIAASQQTHQGSQIRGQGNVNLSAGNELTLRGAEINAGNNLQLQGDTVTVTTVENTNNLNYIASGKTRKQETTTHTSSLLTAGNNVDVTAEQDITLHGSTVNADNNIALNAKGDTTISAAQDESYNYYYNKEKKSWGRSETIIEESYRTNNVGGALTAGNNLTINSEIDSDGNATANNRSGNVRLQGADLSAQQNIAIAGDDIQIVGQKEIAYSRQEKHKSGFGGLSKSSKGSINRAEILRASEVMAEENNLDILSANNITLLGSNLVSGGDLNLNAVGDILISADQVLTETKEWSKKTRFNPISIETIYEREDHLKGQVQASAVGSTLQSGGDITLEASRARVVGSDVMAENNIAVTTDVGDIEIVSADQSLNTFQKDTTVKITMEDMVEQMIDIESKWEQLTDTDDGQAKLTVAKAQYDQVDTKTQHLDTRASSLIAKGNIDLNSAGDIVVIGSDLAADADGNEDGDLNLIAGGDVTISESGAVTDTQTKEIHGKGEVSGVVQHQAVEIVKAAEAVKEAKDQLKNAEEDYRQYQKDLKQLKRQRDQLKADYAAGVPGIRYDDIVDINELIDEVESDEEWYQAGVVLAAANLTSKITLLVQQTAAGAASVATWGFNAGIQIDLEASKTDSESHTETSRASTLAGNNITIQTGSDGNIDQSATSIRGSHLQASNDINITTGDLTIEASRDDSSSKTESESASIRIAQTVYGAAGGPTVSMDYSRSRAKDGNTTYTNSTLTANNIHLNSTGDTTVKGGNVQSTDTLNMDVGGDLLVQSVQNKYSASSNSAGISAGFGLGSNGNDGKTASGAVKSIGKSNGQVSSVNGGLNASNSRIRVKDTVLTSLTGNNVNINVEGHTGLVGATVASVDEHGEDAGNLNLTTQSFDYADLSNTAYSSSRSAGISTSVGLGGSGQKGNQSQQNQTDEKGNSLSLNTSNINLSNSQSYDKSKTLATLGSGNVTIRDDEANGTDSTDRLNRDLNNTEKDLFSSNTGMSVEATIDTRLFTEDGRKQIKNDFVDSYEFGEDIYRASEQLSESDQIGLLSFWTALNNNTKATQLKNDLVRDPANAHIIEGLTSGDGEQYAQAMQALGALAQDKFDLDITSVNFYNSDQTTSVSLADNLFTDVKGATVIDADNSQYGNIFIDAEGTKNDQVNTLGHEILETYTLQTGGSNDAKQEALANAFGGQFEDRIDQATNSQLGTTSTANWSQSLSSSQSVQSGTQLANQVGNAAVDHRQIHRLEREKLSEMASYMAEKTGQDEDYWEKRLTSQLERRVNYQKKLEGVEDKSWDKQADNLLRSFVNGSEEQFIVDEQGEYVLDPHGEKVPLFSNAANYQLKDDTIFGESGEPHGEMPQLGWQEFKNYATNNITSTAANVATIPKDTAIGLYDLFTTNPLVTYDAMVEAVKDLPESQRQKALDFYTASVEHDYEKLGELQGQINSLAVAEVVAASIPGATVRYLDNKKGDFPNGSVESTHKTNHSQGESTDFYDGVDQSGSQSVVTANAEVDGVKFGDTNQDVRSTAASGYDNPTLIHSDIQVKIDKNPDKQYPNANMSTAHAEIGAIQQAFDAGKTQGKNMTMTVSGLRVCDYCRSDIRNAADKAGLNSVTIFEEASGKTLLWTRNPDGTMGKVQVIDN